MEINEKIRAGVGAMASSVGIPPKLFCWDPPKPLVLGFLRGIPLLLRDRNSGTLVERNPPLRGFPLRGFFLFTMFPHQEP